MVIEDDRLIGGLELLDARRGVRTLSVWVVPEERRRGAATRAVRMVAERSAERLEAVTDVADTIAQRVALNAGFTREAVRRGGWAGEDGRRDDVLWARLPDDPPGPADRPLPDLPEGGLRDGEVALRPLGPADADETYALVSRPNVQIWSATCGAGGRARR